MKFLSYYRSISSLFLLCTLLGPVQPCSLLAQTANQPKKELSDKAHEGHAAVIKLFDAKDYDAALKQTDALLANAPAESFEQLHFLQLKAQILINKNDLRAAIEPLETVLRLSEKYKFSDEKQNLQLMLSLGQLYAQEAAIDKSPESQRVKYNKAYTYFRRWLDETKKPNPEIQYFAASVLYNQANFNPEKVDVGLMKQCQIECEKGLMMEIKPREQFYVLLVAALQQQGEVAKSAEYLELLVKRFPNSKTYWQQLMNTYLVQEDYPRAVVTIERAQKLGQLNTPKDNFFLVGIYINTQQYEQAIDLLEAGLRNGAVDADQKNWEHLAQSYQLVHKEQKAIDTLKEAQKLFPKVGAIDLQIGNIYYMTDKYEEALGYLKAAVAKGVDKPSQTYVFIAYLALELKKLEDAKAASLKARELDPKSKEAVRLDEAVNEAIEERDTALGKKAPATSSDAKAKN